MCCRVAQWTYYYQCLKFVLFLIILTSLNTCMILTEPGSTPFHTFSRLTSLESQYLTSHKYVSFLIPVWRTCPGCKYQDLWMLFWLWILILSLSPGALPLGLCIIWIYIKLLQWNIYLFYCHCHLFLSSLLSPSLLSSVSSLMYSLVAFVVSEIRFNYFLQLGICYMLQDSSYVQNEAVMCIHVEIVDMTYELIEVGN